MATLADYGPEARAEAKQVREVVATLHEQLVKWNLVVWTAGNVSQRLRTADLMVIKPSGLRYEYLTPSSMVVRDLDGNVVDGSEAIGEGVVETLREYPKSPAVLMQNHGPFTVGKDAESAVKAAAMTEEVAHTMWAARQLGEIIPISDEDIAKLNDRYTNVYGQQ